MNEKKFWNVYRKGNRMLIVCPDCAEWYELPNCDYELKCYRHCPWCGKPLFIREEDKTSAK
jgi:primosomal protein N'